MIDFGLKQILLYIFTLKKKPETTSGFKGTAHPYVHAPHITNPNNPRLSRFEVFSNAQTFCGKHDPLCSTQNSDLFVTYTDGFKMHTGQPNPQSMISEYISGGKIVLDNYNNKFKLPALNVSNNFGTIDYDAHIKTKIDILKKPCFPLNDSTSTKYFSYSL